MATHLQMNHHCLFILAVWSVAVCVRVGALPSGAPDAACETMTPEHGGARAQSKSTFPFDLFASGQRFTSPRDNLTVTLSSREGGQAFKGFLVLARSEAAGVLGTWSKSEAAHPVAACSAVTHNNNGDKRLVQLTWRPPRNVTSGGKVHFTISVVHNLTTFWVNIPVPVGSAGQLAGSIGGTLAKPGLSGRRVLPPGSASTSTPKATSKTGKSTVAPSGSSKQKTANAKT